PINREQRVYYILYKPRGIISAVTDDKNRKTVVDLMEDVTERVFPIGRLDYNSSGILLLTNDGDFANLLMHPRYEIKKENVVKVKGIRSKQDLEQLKKGIKNNGDLLKAIDCQVKSTYRKKQTAIIDITLQKGKTLNICRMMEHLGYSVSKLSREKYGFLTLN